MCVLHTREREIMALLEGEHITKRFGGVVALKDVPFEIERGETVALLSANGAGKTTILKTICGPLSPLPGSAVQPDSDVTPATVPPASFT